MSKVIGKSGRRLVIITDPHIKIDKDYWVWKEGTDIENKALSGESDNFNSIFVKTIFMTPFKGDCWPGKS